MSNTLHTNHEIEQSIYSPQTIGAHVIYLVLLIIGYLFWFAMGSFDRPTIPTAGFNQLSVISEDTQEDDLPNPENLEPAL
jgi:hypothetical protein